MRKCFIQISCTTGTVINTEADSTMLEHWLVVYCLYMCVTSHSVTLIIPNSDKYKEIISAKASHILLYNANQTDVKLRIVKRSATRFKDSGDWNCFSWYGSSTDTSPVHDLFIENCLHSVDKSLNQVPCFVCHQQSWCSILHNLQPTLLDHLLKIF